MRHFRLHRDECLVLVELLAVELQAANSLGRSTSAIASLPQVHHAAAGNHPLPRDPIPAGGLRNLVNSTPPARTGADRTAPKFRFAAPIRLDASLAIRTAGQRPIPLSLDRPLARPSELAPRSLEITGAVDAFSASTRKSPRSLPWHPAARRLALLLAAPENRIFLVGDDDQTYGESLAVSRQGARAQRVLRMTALPAMKSCHPRLRGSNATQIRPR